MKTMLMIRTGLADVNKIVDVDLREMVVDNPVHEVEAGEGHGEHDPRVLVHVGGGHAEHAVDVAVARSCHQLTPQLRQLAWRRRRRLRDTESVRKLFKRYVKISKNEASSTGCSLNIVFFSPRIFKTLQPLPRQYWAAIGCSENGQPIGMTVNSLFI